MVQKKVPCLNYVYSGCMMQVHHGTSFLLIGGKTPLTQVFCSLESIYVGFLPFNSWRDRIFRGAVVFPIPSFFSIEKPSSLRQSTRRYSRVYDTRDCPGMSWETLFFSGTVDTSASGQFFDFINNCTVLIKIRTYVHNWIFYMNILNRKSKTAFLV